MPASEPVVPIRPPDKMDEEVGVSLAVPYSTTVVDGVFELPRNEELSVKQLVEMRKRDGQARALYRLITLPIRAALKTASFVPADGGETEAEFIEQMFTLPPVAGGMKTTFHRFMAQLLTALFDGFSAFEQVYWVPDSGPLKGKIALKKLAYRPSETINFLTDDRGGFKGLRQRTYFNNQAVDVTIERDNSFYYAANEEENPFYGVSFLNAAFYHYDKKVKLYYLAHLAAQVRAVGARWGTYPDGTTSKERELFKQALTDFGVSQAMMTPEGFKVDDLAKSLAQFDFLAWVDHHNTQMSKSVLSEFIDKVEKGPKLVDFSSQDDDLFLLMLKSVMDEIAANINTYLIPKFVAWNFDSDKYPEFTWGPFTDEQKAAMRATFDKLASASSVNVTQPFLRELEKKQAEEMGLEIDYDAIEAEEAKQAAEQEKAAKAMADAQVEAIKNPKPQEPTQDDGKGGGTVGPGGPKPPSDKPSAPQAVAASAVGGVVPAWATGGQDVLSLTDLARAMLKVVDGDGGDAE